MINDLQSLYLYRMNLSNSLYVPQLIKIIDIKQDIVGIRNF